MVPRVNNYGSSWGGMPDDDERETAERAVGQDGTQAPPPTAAETDGGADGVAPNAVTPVIANEIMPQSPVQTDTRRTSQSSRAGETMQASQQSLQSAGGEGGGGERQQAERPRINTRDSTRRNRPQVARLDYGRLLLRNEILEVKHC